MMKLVIGNKNYSSWSMRPWVVLKAFELPFEEVRLRFDFKPGSAFYQQLARYSPAGKVPVLIDDEGAAVWDSLAIIETLAERFPAQAIWPRQAQARARARSLCADMHAGYGTLRRLCPMNVEAELPEVGTRLLREEPGLQADLARLDGFWADALRTSGGPFLMGDFCAADAFFAPIATRLKTYGLQLPELSQAYAERLLNHPAVQAWVRDALAEQDFIVEDEPYRSAR